MNKKQTRAWIMYDWANSAFATTMIAAVLPIFYSDVAAKTLEPHLRTAYWGYTQFAAMLILAFLSPILGAAADLSGRRVRSVRLFCYIGVCASALFYFVGEGDWLLTSLLFVAGTIGFSGANTFYDALLGDVAEPGKRDMVSARGYASGYLGGGILLAINLAMIMKPAWFGLPDTVMAIRISFVSVAVWWFVFSLPLFRHLKDRPTGPKVSPAKYVQMGTAQTLKTLKQILGYRELLKYMVAFWFFNDGISTIITMATIYGKEIGIGTSHLITALLITQFVGIPFTLLFGKIAERLGSKTSLQLSLGVYVLIVLLGYFMQEAWQFYLLAAMVGLVQGGSQSIARSIYSRLIPPAQSAEYFGFLSVSSKFTSMLGPLVFGLVSQVSGTGRWGIFALLVFFVIGMLILRSVDLRKGEQEALADRVPRQPRFTDSSPPRSAMK
ncbi:MFS transporter [Paenibacillus turpanensis]|uniref:MFS transporter n=1 Tax=Paenibacillus turpanensis TaxID=2689078 RepID=UPI001409BAA3|nr:MFS transporter [Paenibacillus turpanensis]